MGTYNLNGGLLTGGPNTGMTSGGLEIVGVAGTGIFNQTGGTNIATVDLDVGGTAPTNTSATLPRQRRLWNLHPQQWAIDRRGEFEQVGCGWHGDLHADGRNQHNPATCLGG